MRIVIAHNQHLAAICIALAEHIVVEGGAGRIGHSIILHQIIAILRVIEGGKGRIIEHAMGHDHHILVAYIGLERCKEARIEAGSFGHLGITLCHACIEARDLVDQFIVGNI